MWSRGGRARRDACSLQACRHFRRSGLSAVDERWLLQLYTVFSIGDDRLIPVPEQTAIDRFRVPFIIYSLMVKSPRVIRAVTSHLDVEPSIRALLKTHHGISVPDSVAWMGAGHADAYSGLADDETRPVGDLPRELDSSQIEESARCSQPARQDALGKSRGWIAPVG